MSHVHIARHYDHTDAPMLKEAADVAFWAEAFGQTEKVVELIRDVFVRRGATVGDIEPAVETGIIGFEATFSVPGRDVVFDVNVDGGMVWWIAETEEIDYLVEDANGSYVGFFTRMQFLLPDLRPTEIGMDIVHLVSVHGTGILSERVQYSLEPDTEPADLLEAASWIGYALVDRRHHGLLYAMRREPGKVEVTH